MAVIDPLPPGFDPHHDEHLFSRRVRGLLGGLSQASDLALQYEEEITRVTAQLRDVRQKLDLATNEIERKTITLKNIVKRLEDYPTTLSDAMDQHESESLYKKYLRKPKFFRDIVWATWNKYRAIAINVRGFAEDALRHSENSSPRRSSFPLPPGFGL